MLRLFLLIPLCLLPASAWAQVGLDTTKWAATNNVWIDNNGDIDCDILSAVNVSAGILQLTQAYPGSAGIPCQGTSHYGPQTQQYTGGAIWGTSAFFSYGAIEARINWGGNHYHNTFWLMGAGCLATMYQYGPWCNYQWPVPNPEIDIAEIQPGDASHPDGEYDNGYLFAASGNVFVVNAGVPVTGWHVYRLEKSTTALVFKVDGTAVLTLTSNLPDPSMTFYPIISNEVAPSPQLAPVIANLPRFTQVDYVRAWSSTTGESLTDASLIFDDEFVGGQGITAASLRAAQVKQ